MNLEDKSSRPEQHAQDAEPAASESSLDTNAEQPTFGSTLLTILKRLVIGAVAWVALGVLLVLSAFPYGGGNRDLIGLLQLASAAIPIWALIPLFNFLGHHWEVRKRKRSPRA